MLVYNRSWLKSACATSTSPANGSNSPVEMGQKPAASDFLSTCPAAKATRSTPNQNLNVIIYTVEGVLSINMVSEAHRTGMNCSAIDSYWLVGLCLVHGLLEFPVSFEGTYLLAPELRNCL